MKPARSLLKPHMVCLQSALRLKPTFTDAYNNMASALVQKGLIPAALQCYNTALACDPNLVCPCTSRRVSTLAKRRCLTIQSLAAAF